MEKVQFCRRRVASGIRFARVFAVGLAVVSTGLAAQGTGREPQTPFETVNMLYYMIDGAPSRCRHAAPEIATAHRQALSAFTGRNPRLVSLVRGSPHYDTVRQEFARTAAYDRVKDTPENLEPECYVQTETLKLMTTTDRGHAAVRRYETILSR